MQYNILRVRSQFSLQIPLGSDLSKLVVTPLVSKSNFGIAVTCPISHHSYQYHVKVAAHKPWQEEFGNCLSWSLRKPISIKTTPNFQGIILKALIEHGTFDFRKIEQLLIRFKVYCFSDGNFVQEGTSSVMQLLPKKRTRDDTHPPQTDVPIYWVDQTADQQYNDFLDYSIGSIQLSDDDEGMQLAEIDSRLQSRPYYSDANSSDYSSYDGTSSPNNTNEQYMVLYNGNAEVVGNFRALNFYKASDVNLKEDVRLLGEKKVNPRDTLLKIDGVDYKFKKSVSHAANKRFIGYIAQQVESVVPEAVQLIDGILHVDYESLIPYLSESIRANFNDIKHTQAKTERIEKIVDQLYQQFLKQQQKEQMAAESEKKEHVHLIGTKPKATRSSGSDKARAPVPTGCIFLAVITLMLTGAIIGILNLDLAPKDKSTGDVPPTPVAPSQPNGGEPFVEIFQRAILAQFFSDMNGPSWHNNTRWMTDAPLCTWHGIQCVNDEGYVTLVELSFNNLSGTLSPSLGNLTSLLCLILEGNGIEGTIPPQLARLTNLTTLALSNNSLVGPVPEEFSTMRRLQVLHLGNNRLTELPKNIAGMSSLFLWTAENNLFSGTLPDLSVLEELEMVDLSSNYFEGPLPRIPRDIKTLILNDNKLNGTIENLYDKDWLRLVALGNNSLTGEISFTKQQWSSIDTLIMSNNRFTGVKEDNIQMHPNAVCFLRSNDFHCPLPNWVISRCFANCS